MELISFILNLVTLTMYINHYLAKITIIKIKKLFFMFYSQFNFFLKNIYSFYILKIEIEIFNLSINLNFFIIIRYVYFDFFLRIIVHILKIYLLKGSN